MSKHDLQIKEYPVTEDYPATTVAVCLNHDEASAYQRRRTADLETIAEDYGTYICCLDLGCEGEQDCEGNVLRAIGKAYDLGAASVDRKAIVEEAFNKLWSKLKIGAGSINGAETTKKAIDAILAEMGGDDEH